jgi:ubiquitin-protein ligase
LKNTSEKLKVNLEIKIGNESVKSIEDLYRTTLKEEVFACVNDLPNSLFHEGLSGSLSARMTRLSKEVSKFPEFLPCEHTNAIFVRCDEAHLDSMNILISGSKGTPYANGLYHFELICDETFPAKPPKMQLLTGKGKVRFNPNLYENGYVCLSLLGTWSGKGCETWDPAKSTLLQIFLSIQSLIMNNDIHFNEPGYARMKGTAEGALENEGYSNVVKIANIRHAMIEVIKRPPKGFEKVVRNHFLVKKEEILEECAEWLSQKDKPFNQCRQNRNYNSLTASTYGALLEKEMDSLRETL